MSESSSALFSIADDGEFRFARFYIVCEAVMHRNTKKSAHCLRLVGHTPGESKRGRDTESGAVIRLEEIHTFFSNECFICSSTRNLHHALPVILLIKVKYGMLIAAVPFSI